MICIWKQAEGKIIQAEFKELTHPLFQNFGVGYYEGFIFWLGNQYLTLLLKDQKINVYFMMNNDSQTQPISLNIREELMSTLSYYDFKLRFEARLSINLQMSIIFILVGKLNCI